jgi:transcriptional regulator with GAF, ATPase, and Fis domain
MADRSTGESADRTPGSTREAREAAEEDDLRQSLAALSRLATGQLGLEDLLTRVAEYAVAAIPGADGAGLTLIETDGSDTVVASAAFVREIDTIQYALREGPCISAAEQGCTILAGSLGGAAQWPRFGPRVARLGVHSVLSLPLVTPTGPVGAMTVYARPRNAFDERAARIGELFAVPAAVAVHNAQVLAEARRLAGQLQAALTSRAVIDQARGIVMSRTGCDADEAFERLRALSQAENRKLSAVAQALVEDAVRRARARRVHGC